MNWDDIKTAKQLKIFLLSQVSEMRSSGHNVLADKWSARIERMPRTMDKEGINYILLAATWERSG